MVQRGDGMEGTANCDTYDLIHLARGGNQAAKDQLVRDNMGLIYSIARKFANRGYEMDDLVQIGSIGLIKAIDKFDTAFGVKFSTYAVPMIMGEIKRFLRDDGPVKVSRTLKTLAGKAKAIEERLSNKLGRDPTIHEIASEMEIDPEELATALDASRPPESLYAQYGDSDKILLIDKVSGGVDNESKLVNNIALSELIQKLPERERKIIILRYFKEKTQAQIAAMLGISQVQVSRIEKKILTQLRENL